MKQETASGLSVKDLTLIRDTLAAGKRPRVVFTENAGQIAGQIGHVVQLEDPDANDDWILVKFGADVLPFPPSDLAMAPRGAAAKKAAEPAAPAGRTPPEPEFKVVRETQRPARAAEKAADRAADKPVAKPADKPAPRQEKTVTDADKAADKAAEDKSAANAAPAPRKPAPAGKGKAKPVPSFTVTLSYAEGEWSVGAVQGTKTVAKPYVVKPTEALKMVSMLDVPAVHEAIESILSAERAQTQAHAEKLRAELAELEAKLAELGA